MLGMGLGGFLRNFGKYKKVGCVEFFTLELVVNA